jgi:VIT1/CCC1 family predicted Fe2+/Mn2+ transporter
MPRINDIPINPMLVLRIVQGVLAFIAMALGATGTSPHRFTLRQSGHPLTLIQLPTL